MRLRVPHVSLPAPERLQWPVVPRSSIYYHEQSAPIAPQDRLEKQQWVEAGSVGRDVQMNDFERLDIDSDSAEVVPLFDGDFRLVDSNDRSSLIQG